jgi:hypothetical protein
MTRGLFCLFCLLLISVANSYVFYYGTSHVQDQYDYELTWRYCYHSSDIQTRSEITYVLNITKIISQDDFDQKWTSVQNTLNKITKCSKINTIESTKEIRYLDSNCFNFVKTIQMCKFYKNCIWNAFHHTNEFQKILHGKNIFTCEKDYS